MATLLIRNIPENLKREFKILCAREEVTMQEKVIELMKGAVVGPEEI